MPDTRAHVLVQVEPGRSQEAATYLAGLAWVTEAVTTSGPYDVIATVLAGSDDALRRTLAQARRTPGLAALRTCRAG